MPKIVSCQRLTVCGLLCEQLDAYCLAVLYTSLHSMLKHFSKELCLSDCKDGCGNEEVICLADFIQPMLPDEHIEVFLAELENITSFKACLKGRWAELVQL